MLRPENSYHAVRYKVLQSLLLRLQKGSAEDELDVGLETYYVRITPDGIIDHEPMTTIQFHSMADKISFFNSLREP